MVLNNKKYMYVLAAIVANNVKAVEGSLQTAVKMDANKNGVWKVGGPGFRRLGGGISFPISVEAEMEGA